MKSLLIKISMLLLLGAMALTFPSCSDPSPNNEILATDSTHTGWYMGKQVYTTVVAISPTWGQSFYFAYRSGYAVWLITALALWGAAALVIYLKVADKSLFGNKGKTPSVLLIIIFLVAGLGAFGTQPGWIKWNNYKPIPKTQYDYYMQRDGNIKAVWDSLENGHIIGGPKSK